MPDLDTRVYECAASASSMGATRTCRFTYGPDCDVEFWYITPPGHWHEERWPGGSQRFARTYEIIPCEHHAAELAADLAAREAALAAPSPGVPPG